MEVKKFDSSEGNVWKYVFDFGDAIAEAVLYRYESFEKRTVICCSVQSGCPVGCKFCGTGKRFIRNLTSAEIFDQVKYIIDGIEGEGFGSFVLNDECEKLQIMFMSMGEPMLNWDNVSVAIEKLNYEYANAQLLISTIGVNNKTVLDAMMISSYQINKIGLQFSIHQALDEKRNELIPYKNKLSLREIRDYGIQWAKMTQRQVYLNYCVDGNNISTQEIERLKDLFNPATFAFTFSVVCAPDENMKDVSYRNHDTINKVMETFLEDGYNVRVFDPAGQDDIGGGCGQLWYTQDWMKNHLKLK